MQAATKTVQSTTSPVNVGTGMMVAALDLSQPCVRHLVSKIDEGPESLRGERITSWGLIKIYNKVIKEILDLYLNAFFIVTGNELLIIFSIYKIIVNFKC